MSVIFFDYSSKISPHLSLLESRFMENAGNQFYYERDHEYLHRKLPGFWCYETLQGGWGTKRKLMISSSIPRKSTSFFCSKKQKSDIIDICHQVSGQKHPITNWHSPHQKVKFLFVFSWTMFISVDIFKRLEGISFKYKMPAQNLKACRVNQQKALYSSLQCV